jgi:hypothetical protein
MPAAKPTAVELELLELELLVEELLKLASSMSIQSSGECDASSSVAPSTSIAVELELLELLLLELLLLLLPLASRCRRIWASSDS